MNEYEFNLSFRLPDDDADPDGYLGALAQAGCDDAAVGVGRRGRIALAFVREAGSAFDAIASAVQAVKAAIPGAVLIEASPDFVGLTDVADIAGFSRQNMRKLMLANPSFPPPFHAGTASLWHLATILHWLRDTQKREINGTLFDIAATNMALNIAKETLRLPGASLPKELAPLFA